jgi:hypothetical protein
MIARICVFEREEELAGVLWTFYTVRPPAHVLIGLPSGYNPPSVVNFRNARGGLGLGELPPGRFLADATSEQLTSVLEHGTHLRQGNVRSHGADT